MGLLRAAMNAAGSVIADQWREYFYCEALDKDVMVVKGKKRTGGRSYNTRGEDNIISNGSIIAVADGQCMIIVDQGKVTEVCAVPGEFVYDSSSESSIFSGDLSENIQNTFKVLGKRFTFGGDTASDQRVYYFNTKELMGNKYGTASPVPFRVVDQNIGLDIDISLRCFGEYSYRISDPILFYTNVCGNVAQSFTRQEIDSQLKTELLTALQPAFGRLSEMGIRYSALPGHTMELADALNDILSSKWRDLRGLEIVSFGVSVVKASDEDEAMIKELQRNATFRNPAMAAAQLVGAQSASMQSAAKNEGGMGAMGAFMGVNMAQNMGGFNAQNLFQMAQQQPAPQPQPVPQPAPAPQSAPQPAAPANAWTCSCGAVATGKFCPECGSPKPAPTPQPAADGWICQSCGAVNKGKFCMECGAKKPAGIPQYRCDKCGWEPADPTHPPKFCPECGDPFNEADIK